MVRLTRIYTRGGDKGMTSLVGGERRVKYDRRVDAYGTVDETNAAIGVARLHTSGEADAMLARIQQELFDLGADLATPSLGDPKALRIVPEQVKRLEREIDTMNKALPLLDSFILPGGAPIAAFLHLARTICRRAERLVSELMEKEPVNPVALQYLNRLSDHLFVLSRFVVQAAPQKNGEKKLKEVLWKPGSTRGRIQKPKNML